MSPTYEEIKLKVPTAHYAPKTDCKYCKGTGFRHKHLPAGKFLKEMDIDVACICLFVDHEYSDEMQELLNKAVQDLRTK